MCYGLAQDDLEGKTLNWFCFFTLQSCTQSTPEYRTIILNTLPVFFLPRLTEYLIYKMAANISNMIANPIRFMLFILLCIGACSPVQGMMCPERCDCYDMVFGVRALRCFHKQLREVPAGIHSETILIDLADNQLKILRKDVFEVS